MMGAVRTFWIGAVLGAVGGLAGTIARTADSPCEQIVDTLVVRDTVALTTSAYRDFLVLREAEHQGVDPSLALAVARVENTRGLPTAVSSAGAVGLLQVMPRVWNVGGPIFSYCVDRSGPPWSWGTPPVDLHDPVVNVCFGLRILRRYLERCEGDEECALARYNGAVTPWKIEAYLQSVATERETT